ncbi:MAG: hypothetical protein SNJ69_08990 [Chloroflexaceae bacterium]
MARYPKITLAPHLSADELKQRYRACDDALFYATKQRGLAL